MVSSKKLNYLLDVSWLLYKGHFAFHEKEYGEVFFLLLKIKSYLKSGDVYLCLDGMHPKGRILNESYKENRVHEYNVYQKLPGVLYSLQNLDHVKIKYNDSLEADEVIFSLTRILDGTNIIVSGDNDLLQSLLPNVSIDRGSERITEDYYKVVMSDKFHSIPPYRLPIYRSIVGDSSDNMKSIVNRFPHRIASELAKEIPYCGQCPSKSDVEVYRDSLEKDSEKRWVSKLLDKWDDWNRSFQIMKLDVYDNLDESPRLDASNRLTEEHYRMLKSIRLMDRDKGVVYG